MMTSDALPAALAVVALVCAVTARRKAAAGDVQALVVLITVALIALALGLLALAVTGA